MKQENLEWMITIMRCLYIKKLSPALTGDHKNIKESTIYYIENKKKAMISTYCVAGVCATPEIIGKSSGSMQDMYLVTHEINHAILGLLDEIM